MTRLSALPFDNAYARLGPGFGTPTIPTPFRDSRLVAFSPGAAATIGLGDDPEARAELEQALAGRLPIEAFSPVAMLYAGHQFGVYVPQLGDGRAVLLGQVRGTDGRPWDLHLKGGGPTAYARAGDGRAVLRSVIREYLGSEAMAGLGIPTTRAVCLLASESPVYREEVEPGAMLLRVAPTHVRFGSFEVFFYRQQHDRLATLADHVIDAHFPEWSGAPGRHVRLLETAVERTARLMAEWQAVGFAHGVMNTDNLSILGITLDYGPFGFLDAFEPGFVCNHSDDGGRYAFDRQPHIGHWNCRALAQAMLPLVGREAALAALDRFEPTFFAHWRHLMRGKLGLETEQPDDVDLVGDLLSLLAASAVDWTRFWRDLGSFPLDPAAGETKLRDRFLDREAFDAWATRYRARLGAEGSVDADRHARMRRTNPKFVLRNWVAQAVIEKAERGDFDEIDRVRAVLESPYDEHPALAHYAEEPPEWGRRLVVSCSS